ncbi:DUF917 family protein, partial [Candidatus Bathyarchaeota archaeon]|nr:DUF917 family protein [Candidatus Bathyarchaeota archaeon]
MKVLTEKNLLDYIAGAVILGCGGGGGSEWGKRMVDDALEKGCSFKLADISEIDGEAML